jgi:hypothetical protein
MFCATVSIRTKEFKMYKPSNVLNVKQLVAMIKEAHRRGDLKGHHSESAAVSGAREVLASWGSAMRR